MNERRLRISGIHHITLLCADVEGRGSTHHFALSVGDDEELSGWRDYLVSQGIPVTEVLDRTYFKSVYLRDPDGHIVELATLGPGLTADEPLEELGRRPV
jgi:glyoxalase family protein